MSEDSTEHGGSQASSTPGVVTWGAAVLWFLFWIAVARVHYLQDATLDLVFTAVWAAVPLAIVVFTAVTGGRPSVSDLLERSENAPSSP